MKKTALAIILALTAVVSHAASAIKTFTTHTQGGPVLYVLAGESFNYSVSGTFVGIVKIERSDNGVNYETTGLQFSAAVTGNHLNETRKDQAYRVYCSTYSSGSIVTSLSDVADELQEFKNGGGVAVLRILDNGIEVPGTITAGSISGAVSTSGVDLSTVTAAIDLKTSKAGDTMTGALDIAQPSPSGAYLLRVGTSTPSGLYVSTSGRVGIQTVPDEQVFGRGMFNVSGETGQNVQLVRSGGQNIRSYGDQTFSLNIAQVSAVVPGALTVPTWSIQLSSGTVAVPARTANGHVGQLDMRGHTGTAFTGSRARVQFQATEDWTATANGVRTIFATTPNLSATPAERMRIEHNGFVKIGTGAPGTLLEVSSGVVTINGTGAGLVVNDGVGITATSSVTASGFFGDGAGLTGFVVFGSSSSTNTKAIDSTAFVQVTTMTITLRGGRALSGMATVHIENTSGAGRTYTAQVERGGVAVSNQYLNFVSAGDNQTVPVQWSEASSTAGVQVYTLSLKSSNGAATQSAMSRILTVTEF